MSKKKNVQKKYFSMPIKLFFYYNVLYWACYTEILSQFDNCLILFQVFLWLFWTSGNVCLFLKCPLHPRYFLNMLYNYVIICWMTVFNHNNKINSPKCCILNEITGNLNLVKIETDITRNMNIAPQTPIKVNINSNE